MDAEGAMKLNVFDVLREIAFTEFVQRVIAHLGVHRVHRIKVWNMLTWLPTQFLGIPIQVVENPAMKPIGVSLVVTRREDKDDRQLLMFAEHLENKLHSYADVGDDDVEVNVGFVSGQQQV